MIIYVRIRMSVRGRDSTCVYDIAQIQENDNLFCKAVVSAARKCSKSIGI